MQDLPLVREVHGFRRTECACAFCTVYCRHMPGTLDPADLIPLCGDQQDVLVWAEQHLRALVDQPYPTLVPARNHQGHCHWYFDGKCAVHKDVSYSCAFFDAHQSELEVARRTAATIQACKEDAAANGLYYRVWRHLCMKGLIARRGDRQPLLAEIQEIRRRLQRSQRRTARGYLPDSGRAPPRRHQYSTRGPYSVTSRRQLGSSWCRARSSRASEVTRSGFMGSPHEPAGSKEKVSPTRGDGGLYSKQPDGDGTLPSIEIANPNRQSPDVDSDHPTAVSSHQINALD